MLGYWTDLHCGFVDLAVFIMDFSQADDSAVIAEPQHDSISGTVAADGEEVSQAIAGPFVEFVHSPLEAEEGECDDPLLKAHSRFIGGNPEPTAKEAAPKALLLWLL